MKVMITGGARYIGSTVASACLDAGIRVVVLDDLSTGRAEFGAERNLYRGDIADATLLERIVKEHPDINLVIHCAARIVVPDSVAEPLDYYDVNVGRTLTMVRLLAALGVSRVLFSSSAAIYSGDSGGGVDEDAEIAPGSPYASTKWMVEQILRDSAQAGKIRAVALRYFNPIGADPRLRTGLQSLAPSHALGKIMTARATATPFTLTGTDWNTRDGSGLRDYIHVWDLARAHVAAVQRFDGIVNADDPYSAMNIGTGHGVTVRELVSAFEAVTGEPLEVIESGRRPGDQAGAFALVGRAEAGLGWKADRSVEDGVRDALAWAEKLKTLNRS
ncbi:UDP-glucose 4-epimerase GalE [Microbacterium esteraromaticum]|nr:UDP-glucose 4-epimerase GalE [Microbacterium esteraromaticum]